MKTLFIQLRNQTDLSWASFLKLIDRTWVLLYVTSDQIQTDGARWYYKCRKICLVPSVLFEGTISMSIVHGYMRWMDVPNDLLLKVDLLPHTPCSSFTSTTICRIISQLLLHMIIAGAGVEYYMHIWLAWVQYVHRHNKGHTPMYIYLNATSLWCLFFFMHDCFRSKADLSKLRFIIQRLPEYRRQLEAYYMRTRRDILRLQLPTLSPRHPSCLQCSLQ